VIAFATLFNELLTVAAMYGKGFREPYICWRRTVARKRLRIALPVSPHWKLTYVRKSQHVGTITQTRPNGKPLRTIKIWRYKWNTVYSGVGGENCRKLAEVIHELDRDEVKASGGKVSSRVRVKKLNRHFKRVYHYRLETYDSELEDIVRRREFYFKGTSATFNFEVTEHCGWKDDDDALTRFRIDNEGVELMHVLQSLEPNDD